MTRFRSWLFGLSSISALLLATPVKADTIKIVVPFAAGGPVDQLARLLANGLVPKLNANVIVDDKGGAGGAIGCEFVAHAAPDGGTMLLASLGSYRAQPDPEAANGVRPGEILRAGDAGRRGAVAARGQQGPRRRHIATAHRQGEGAETHLRLGRTGHDHEHRRRNAQCRGRRENHARALSRRSASDQRFARRPCRHAQCRSAGAAAAGKSRHGQGARAVCSRAHAAACRICRRPRSSACRAW